MQVETIASIKDVISTTTALLATKRTISEVFLYYFASTMFTGLPEDARMDVTYSNTLLNDLLDDLFIEEFLKGQNPNEN